MKLQSQIIGNGHPLIILHGLYGSSDNWLTHGKALADEYTVHLVDQRNHGNSPHTDEHNYTAMEGDLLEYLDQHQIDRAIIMGHSMGGKTAMFFALAHPERVSTLIIVDMSPMEYDSLSDAKTLFHKEIFKGLLSIDLPKLKNRTDAEKQLKPYIPQVRIRKFLLKNLQRNPDDKSFHWQLNLKGLYESLDNILEGIDPEMVSPITAFPILFIKGEESEYINSDSIPIIRAIFPYAEISTIAETGHWLHAEKPEEFMKIVKNFLE
ncbi:MAG: alpha/beta fold hydrolase [Salinivirgaceae bacterium]|jgi:esterase|nr:alpha/beta fold hydrolase [Salinivirgaceae bacterium]